MLFRSGVYPIELYTEARIKEFEQRNTIPPALEVRVAGLLKKKKKK